LSKSGLLWCRVAYDGSIWRYIACSEDGLAGVGVVEKRAGGEAPPAYRRWIACREMDG